MRRAPRSSLFALLTALWLPAGALAETAPKPAATARDIRTAEHARAAELAAQKDAAARAAKAIADEQRLTEERIAAAARQRDAEAATAEAAARMDDLAERRRMATAQMQRQAEAMQPLLPMMTRLALYPAETLLAVPGPPEDRLRGLLILRGLSQQLEANAKALRQAQTDLDAATAAIAAETPRLNEALAAQAARAADLDRLLDDAQDRRLRAETEAGAAAQRAADAASRAETLRSALSMLEAQRKAEAAQAHAEALQAERQKHDAEAAAARQREAALARPTGSLSRSGQPKGQLAAPVAGKIIRAFGDPTDAGPATGLSYQAAPNARVIAPCAGRVAFADRFRTYGQLVIIDCGGGYHAVLSGLERLDAKVGQGIQAGEPVGTMPTWEPGGTARRPSLYIELRHDGQPVNPAPWLRAKG
jgi:septal ring factor EnvC (AmiA/AmiB activator)